MFALTLLLVVSLLDVVAVKGSEHVFVLQGADLRLDVNTSVRLSEDDIFTWKVGNENILKFFSGKTVVTKPYKGIVKLLDQSYSLLLTNVQQHHSGLYKSVIYGEKDTTVAEYKVTVQALVSAASLTVIPNNSPDCNLTVTCHTEDLHIRESFICDAQNCSQVGTARTYFPALNVYLLEEDVICNHSNKVSWKEERKKIRSYCVTEPVSNKAIKIAGVTCGALLLMVLCIVICIIKCKRERITNTEYELPQDVRPNRNQSSTSAGDFSVYSLVQLHTGPVEPNNITNNSQPETIYSLVNKPAKPS